MSFSTKDKDNDHWGGYSCSTSGDEKYGGAGGWWFRACGRSNLNGRNVKSRISDMSRMRWDSDPTDPRNTKYELKASKMELFKKGTKLSIMSLQDP